MFEYYNPHPQNKIVGDCVKRALTKASGKTYQEVSNELNRIKRSIGASAYNSNKVWPEYVTKNLSGIYESYPAKKGQPRMNGERFCESHPEGTYVLRMAGHLSCCVDGVIYDTWDCLEKCVYGSYRIPKFKVNGIYHADEVCASAPPKMMPMPGIEKLADLKKEYEFNGNDIIYEMAETADVEEIKKTRKNELWISLNDYQYKVVLNILRDGLKYKNLSWEVKRSKTYLRDMETGMELILKKGEGAYLWCTNNGK